MSTGNVSSVMFEIKNLIRRSLLNPKGPTVYSNLDRDKDSSHLMPNAIEAYDWLRVGISAKS